VAQALALEQHRRGLLDLVLAEEEQDDEHEWNLEGLRNRMLAWI
jgi:hypothetical protein